MEAATVYFTSLRCRGGDNLQKKLKRLLTKAGMGNIDFDNKFVAVKIHFGELGNLAYLRPNYAKTVCDFIKECGGKPFLTDCNTLYVGGRKNALDHLETAYINGYSPFSTGCHILIADGLKGTDDVEVPVAGGEYVKNAKIGRAVMDADIVISLNHFKGHELTGFGGALKNLGMGCGSRAGKMEMHSAGKPFVDSDLCIGCGKCGAICAHGAPQYAVDENGKRKATVDHNKCVGCGRCIGVCPTDAMVAANDENNDILNCKIAEYAKAVIDGRPNFHINLVVDVSPYCDCHEENDAAIVPNIGMFASFDPVALDIACADAVNKQQPVRDSLLFDSDPNGKDADHFHAVSPTTNWMSAIDHGVKLGIGSKEYKLVEIK